MKKILFFIPSLSGRGAEKVLVNLVNNLDKKKYKITILSLFNVGINKQYLQNHIEYKYVFNNIFRGNIYFFKIFRPKMLFKNMIKNKYDVIVSYLQSPTTRIVSACPDKNVKLINWIHNETKNLKVLTKVYRNRKEFEECFKKFNMTVFVSETAKKSFEKATGLELKSCVKYNCVEDKIIRAKSKEMIDDIKYDKNKINLISVGGLVEQKGYERLLRIINKLRYDNKNIHLYILGEGEKRKILEKYIQENDLKKYVTLLGYKENPYKYVANADLFVCSSYYEGYSTAVTEALIVQTPVITTLCSGMEELLESGKYGIITENEEDALYNELHNIINNRSILNEYKKMAIERSEQFNLEKNIKEIEEVL